MYTIDGLDFVQVFENGRKTAPGIVFFQKQVDMGQGWQYNILCIKDVCALSSVGRATDS